MDFLHRVELWGDRHHPKWMDYVRIILGVFLCFKGIQFPQHMSQLLSKLPGAISGNTFLLVLFSHYVLFSHLMGGILLVFGVFTRFACLIQLPILLGAVFFINAANGLWQPYSELYLSVLVLLLLIYFLVAGNGSLSASKYLIDEKKTGLN